MDLATITSAFRALITIPELRAIVVDGPWGAGKTYFAKKFAKDNAELIEEKGMRFAYVSLFGATSLAEVRSRICLTGDGWQKAAAKIKAPETLFGFDLGNIGSVAKEVIEDRFLRNLFVCIDDLERADTNVSVNEVLGLVSELTQERGCKCMLLLNADELQNRDVFKTYTEKVFDLELAFKPRPEDVIHIGLPKEKWAALALPVFQRVRYANIRVMQRVNWVLREIEAIGETSLTEKFWPQIVQQAAALCICHYAYRPLFGGSLDSLRSWSQMSYQVRKALPLQKGEQDAGDPGKDLLLELDYDREPYDGAIITLLQTGGLPRVEMINGLKQAAAEAENDTNSQRYFNLWEHYNGNFSTGLNDFHKLLSDYLTTAADSLRDNEVLDSCNLLLTLRDDAASRALATRCLVRVVEKVPGKSRIERYKGYKKLSSSGVFRGIGYKPDVNTETLEELFLGLTSDHNFLSEKFADFARFSTKELTDFLVSYRGDRLFYRLSEFYKRLEVADDELRYPLQQRMNGALKAVAKLDPLNQVRVDWIAKDLRNRHKPTAKKTKAKASPSKKEYGIGEQTGSEQGSPA